MNAAATDHPWPELLADLRRYVGRRVKDTHVAEDIVQDTFAKLAAQLACQRPAGPLHAWVLRVARNAIVDHYRARRPAEPTNSEPAAPPADGGVERAGLLASFRSFVQALPPEQREALLLAEYEGVSQAEIAQRLGIPVSTVKSRVQRGRKRLSQALRDCCSFEFDRRGRIVDWQRHPGGGCRDC